MKKTYSFSLEEDIISEIKKYQEVNKLSSASSALERIILEYIHIKDVKSSLKDVLMEFMENEQIIKVNTNKKDVIEEKREVEDDSEFVDGIQSCFDNIPD